MCLPFSLILSINKLHTIMPLEIKPLATSIPIHLVALTVVQRILSLVKKSFSNEIFIKNFSKNLISFFIDNFNEKSNENFFEVCKHTLDSKTRTGPEKLVDEKLYLKCLALQLENDDNLKMVYKLLRFNRLQIHQSLMQNEKIQFLLPSNFNDDCFDFEIFSLTDTYALLKEENSFSSIDWDSLSEFFFTKK